MFLSKEERAAEALRKRQEEVEKQRKKMEEERKARQKYVESSDDLGYSHRRSADYQNEEREKRRESTLDQKDREKEADAIRVFSQTLHEAICEKYITSANVVYRNVI